MNKAAQALGRLAAGKPKNYSAEEIARRSKILAAVNERKRKASKAPKRQSAETQDAQPRFHHRPRPAKVKIVLEITRQKTGG
ncbi:MAG: hypothetical protein KA004_17350 [Verrucomicrobiales bacterium]|nr:hypothetical protein [Verrucomicrobiales bacterium]